MEARKQWAGSKCPSCRRQKGLEVRQGQWDGPEDTELMSGIGAGWGGGGRCRAASLIVMAVTKSF